MTLIVMQSSTRCFIQVVWGVSQTNCFTPKEFVVIIRSCPFTDQLGQRVSNSHLNCIISPDTMDINHLPCCWQGEGEWCCISDRGRAKSTHHGTRAEFGRMGCNLIGRTTVGICLRFDIVVKWEWFFFSIFFWVTTWGHYAFSGRNLVCFSRIEACEDCIQ